MPARLSVVSTTPPPGSRGLRRAPVATCVQLPPSGGIRLVGHKAATLMRPGGGCQTWAGNFGKMFPKFLLHEDPRTHAKARREGWASVGRYTAPT